MCHKYSKSYFHDAEQLRRFVDDCKEKFTTSAGGQIVELDFHIAVKINSSALSNGCTIDEPDTINGDTHKVNDNKIVSLIFLHLILCVSKYIDLINSLSFKLCTQKCSKNFANFQS